MLLISETSARKKLNKQKGLCFVCLKEGHLAKHVQKNIHVENVTGDIALQYALFLNQVLIK